MRSVDVTQVDNGKDSTVARGNRQHPGGESSSEPPVWKRLARQRELPLLVVIILFGAIMTVERADFLTVDNLTAVGIAIASDAIIAVAMTALLITGMFDLSVSSTLALSGVVTGILVVNHGVALALAVGVAVLVGAAVGAVNGAIVTRLGVNPLITTFGMLSAVSSVALLVSSGQPLSGFPSAFLYVGQGRVAHIPVAIIVVVAAVTVGQLVLRRTRFARQLFYVGSNPQAATLSGISVTWVRLIAFVAVGAAAALAGLLSTSRLGAAYPLAGTGTELRVIAACVIGGCSLSGGEGSIVGSFFGVVFMGLVTNALVLLNINISWQGFAYGAVLILAVGLDQFGKRRRLRRTPS